VSAKSAEAGGSGKDVLFVGPLLKGPRVEHPGDRNRATTIRTRVGIIRTSWSYSIEAIDRFSKSFQAFTLSLFDIVPIWQWREIPIFIWVEIPIPGTMSFYGGDGQVFQVLLRFLFLGVQLFFLEDVPGSYGRGGRIT